MWMTELVTERERSLEGEAEEIEMDRRGVREGGTIERKKETLKKGDTGTR